MKVDLAALELVSVDGELAVLIRLGRRPSDPVPQLDRIKRSFRISEPEQETLGPFLAEATAPRLGARCRAGPLYARYRAWCEVHAAERLSLVGFHRAMKARGFRQVISNGHWWRDLAMQEDCARGPLL